MNVKQLKELIKDLSDDLPVEIDSRDGYNFYAEEAVVDEEAEECRMGASEGTVSEKRTLENERLCEWRALVVEYLGCGWAEVQDVPIPDLAELVMWIADEKRADETP